MAKEQLSRYIYDNDVYLEDSDDSETDLVVDLGLAGGEALQDDSGYFQDEDVDSNDENHPKNDYPDTPSDSSAEKDENEGDFSFGEGSGSGSSYEGYPDFGEGDQAAGSLRLYKMLGRKGKAVEKGRNGDFGGDEFGGYRGVAFDFWHHREDPDETFGYDMAEEGRSIGFY